MSVGLEMWDLSIEIGQREYTFNTNDDNSLKRHAIIKRERLSLYEDLLVKKLIHYKIFDKI